MITRYEHKIEETEVTLSKKQEKLEILKQHKKKRDDVVQLAGSGEMDTAFASIREMRALEKATDFLQKALEEYQGIVASMKLLQASSLNVEELEREITDKQDDYVILDD